MNKMFIMTEQAFEQKEDFTPGEVIFVVDNSYADWVAEKDAEEEVIEIPDIDFELF